MEQYSITVFVDRDGVINRIVTEKGPRETPTTVDELELLPRAQAALALLKERGYRVIVITNQPNVAKGKSTWKEAEAIDQKFLELLGPEAAPDAVYACRHHPDPAQVVVPELLHECECRKPKPGLILQAAQKYGIDMRSAWLIGDAETDIQAGRAAGIPEERMILVTSAVDLWAAVQTIILTQT